MFGITSAKFVDIGHVPLLGEIGVLELLSLAAIGIRELETGSEHYLGKLNKSLVAKVTSHLADLWSEQHPIDIDMLVLC